MSGQDDGRHEYRPGGDGYCAWPCGQPGDDPIHAPLAAQEAFECRHHAGICTDDHEECRPSAGDDAATDVDSTAERYMVVGVAATHCGCAVSLPAGFSFQCPHGTYIRTPGSPLRQPASPVTAGVPDTDACGCVEGYEWRARQDAVCGNCPRRGETPAGVPDTAAIRSDHRERHVATGGDSSGRVTFGPSICAYCGNGSDWPCTVMKLCDALDAARGELVTARGERDSALVVVRGHRGQIVELREELAAANARIASVEALCDGLEQMNAPDMHPELHEVCDQVRSAVAGVPAAGDGDG